MHRPPPHIVIARLYSDQVVDSAPLILHAPSPTSSSMHRHQAGSSSTTSTEYAPRRQHRAAPTSPWSSSPRITYTTIAASSPPPPIVVNVNAKRVLFRRIRVKSPTYTTFTTRSTSTNVVFVHHDLAIFFIEDILRNIIVLNWVFIMSHGGLFI